MAKIGQFIYPWGNGHYSRMMRLNEKLKELGDNEFHYFSKGDIYQKLLERSLLSLFLLEEEDGVATIPLKF